MIPIEVYEQSIRSFLTPIHNHLDDPSVTEIMINGPTEVFIERAGRLHRTTAQFSMEALLAAIRNIAQYQGVTVDSRRPVLEARLPDGSRVEAILPPAGSRGPHMAIRRFSKETLTVGKLVTLGALTQDAADTLRVLVEIKQNLVVSGGTGSGKTSMLNALSSFVPDGQRVVVIEDARELQLQGTHVVHLEAQKPDPRGQGGIATRDLFKATLRMRPDRIILGEIRSEEALDLVQAMTSGHGGCMTTVHANHPADTLRRLEAMALMGGTRIPLFALRAQIASAVDVVVQTERVRDGSRCVTRMTEVLAATETGYTMNDLFVRRFLSEPGESRALRSVLEPSGNLPKCAAIIHDHGYRLPETVYAAATTEATT